MKLELLAPAGSIAGMKAVIAAGADAVYIGGNRFGARAYAENPGEEALIRAIRYAHLRGVRVYLTVNTLLRDEELSELKDWLAPYVEAGLDAVLVQDFGVLRLLRREFPRLAVHASTQMTVTGPEGAMLLRDLGVSRVVPAREMSLAELKRIRQMSGLEVEAFVHGALCVCFSGQCLFSSLLGGRSGNRGRCAQPCRLPYRFAGERKEGELLSPKDLCALDLLPQMAAAGVVSFKIEGRMKQPAYAAGVTAVYKKYLELLTSGKPYRVDPADRERLYTLFNRGGFTDGYFTRRNGPEMMARKGRELTIAEDQARAALYAAMDEQYVLPEDSLGLMGEARICAGQPAELTLSPAEYRGALTDRGSAVRVTVYGEEVLPARNAPLTEDKIREQLKKTGGSGFAFRGLSILTDGNAFLPAKSLNELRRKGLMAVEEEILRKYPRIFAKEGEVGLGPSAEGVCDSPEEPLLSAVCDTLPQALAAAEAGADRVYLDAAAICMKARGCALTEVCGELVRSLGKGRLFIATPLAERAGETEALYDQARELLAEGIGGFLVRSFEAFAHMRRLGLAAFCLADAPVYTWNKEAMAFARELGFAGDVAPYELSKAQLARRMGARDALRGFYEAQIYGRQTLMVTAQCLRKNNAGCTKRPGVETLVDRTGTAFPVRCNCTFCSNIIYNSVPHSLFREIPFFRKLGFSSLRLAFTVESPEEAGRLVRIAADLLRRRPGSAEETAERKAGKSGGREEPVSAYTRGQFSKGVE